MAMIEQDVLAGTQKLVLRLRAFPCHGDAPSSVDSDAADDLRCDGCVVHLIILPERGDECAHVGP